ncbi:outer membrane protein with beta-barrel domain [Salegentibacter sp. 24]|uniref:outer membrane beta-barrel protein n=1 Tax=Salegentibacter sp. 24 TaxID=2183986 RepID=UPI00105BC6AF|nr:outer membrane beta-barrel protein [Salegentibacter sp. 24]TDN89440.1 outer membrane protein with beta-barrel domain [Salegentibacter sp. 24]
MKKILHITFLLLQITVHSQNNSQWSIGIEFSTDNLSFSGDGDRNDYIVTDGNINGYAVEFDKKNYSFGISADYFIQENFGLSSGILYANKDLIGTYSCATCDYSGSFLISVSETLKQRFLTIPISITYSFLKGKLKPIVEGGLKNNFEIANDLDTISKGYFLEAFIGASIYYEFIKNLEGGIGYNYQAAISDLYKTDEFNLRTNSFYLRINYLFN